jgi:hypothetical protein
MAPASRASAAPPAVEIGYVDAPDADQAIQEAIKRASCQNTDLHFSAVSPILAKERPDGAALSQSLTRSTDTIPDATDGMDERIGLLTVDLAANASDIDVDDVGRGIEMEIPYMLQ